LGFLSNALAPGAGGGAKPAEGGPVGKADVDAIGARDETDTGTQNFGQDSGCLDVERRRLST
jgi:hypothetical protein